MFINFLFRFKNYFASRFSSITINQANFFILFLLFIFTIIFASMLIQENYYDYEKALKSEQKPYVEYTLDDYEQEHIRNQKN